MFAAEKNAARLWATLQDTIHQFARQFAPIIWRLGLANNILFLLIFLFNSAIVILRDTAARRAGVKFPDDSPGQVAGNIDTTVIHKTLGMPACCHPASAGAWSAGMMESPWPAPRRCITMRMHGVNPHVPVRFLRVIE
jgi:hypothetical protein